MSLQVRTKENVQEPKHSINTQRKSTSDMDKCNILKQPECPNTIDYMCVWHISHCKIMHELSFPNKTVQLRWVKPPAEVQAITFLLTVQQSRIELHKAVATWSFDNIILIADFLFAHLLKRATLFQHARVKVAPYNWLLPWNHLFSSMGCVFYL